MEKFIILAGHSAPMRTENRLDTRVNNWLKSNPYAHIIDWHFIMDTSTPGGNHFICIRYFEDDAQVREE